MSLTIISATNSHLFNAIVDMYLSIVNDTTGVSITGESPTLSIRRSSDGFFFDGAAFVDTSGTPTVLNMSEIDATAAPGLYVYTFNDPGPIVPTLPTLQLSEDIYEVNFINSGAPPAGGSMWSVRKFTRQLRDINTQGS